MKRKVKKSPAHKPISYVARKRYGILNHIGGIWTPKTFDTESEARRYLKSQMPLYGDLSRHTVIPVRVTVTALRSRDGGRG